MIHTILYHGRFSLNFDRLHELKDDFTIRRPDGKGFFTLDSPADKVDGIVFGYMEKSKRGLGADRFYAVKVEDVILDRPVRIDPKRHTDGKRFGPIPSQFGDDSASRLLADIVEENPGQEDELRAIYESTFDIAEDFEK
jgi:hypothetical protein